MIASLKVANKCSEYTAAHNQLELDCTRIHLSLQQVLSCVLSLAQSSFSCLCSLGCQSDYLVLTLFPRNLFFPAWRPLWRFGEQFHSFLSPAALAGTHTYQCLAVPSPRASLLPSSGTTHPHTGMAQEGKWRLLKLCEKTFKYLCNYSDIFLSEKATSAYYRLGRGAGGGITIYRIGFNFKYCVS